MVSLEERLRVSEHIKRTKALGDIVMSAINCDRLGIRSYVKHFNWMG